MIKLIHNVARNYAWGSRTMLTSLGIEPTGEPMAEIWFGTHHGSPSVLADNQKQSLKDYLGGRELPFLLKLLAAQEPLSIQAHPNSEQARVGFAREEALGVPQDSPTRNYKDDRHKPEMVVALSDEFHALCGFRPMTESQTLFDVLGTASQTSEEFRLIARHVANLLTNDGLAAGFHYILEQPEQFVKFAKELSQHADAIAHDCEQFGASLRTAAQLYERYPADVGVVLSLLMNHAVLEPGQALFLPAGNIHAYLYGLAVEVMASSDNVIRGGLTEKHIDIDELSAIVDFIPHDIPFVEPRTVAAGVVEYPVPVTDFMLYRISLETIDSAEVNQDRNVVLVHASADTLLLCTAGSISVASQQESLTFTSGQAVYLGGESNPVTLSGDGVVFLASSGTHNPIG